MMLTGEVCRKKNAVRNQIRKKWLKDYFTSRRNQFINIEFAEVGEINQILNNLPLSISKLSDKIFSYRNQITRYNGIIWHLIKKINEFIRHLKQNQTIQLSDFMSYIFVSEKIVYVLSQQYPEYEAQALQLFNLLSNCARNIALNYKQHLKIILMSLIRFTIVMKNHLLNITTIQVCIIGKVIKDYILQIDIESCLDEIRDAITLINTMLTLQYEDFKQNVDQKLMMDLGYKKQLFIGQLYEDKRVIKKLISIIVVSQKQLLQYTLRLFVSLTFILRGEMFYRVLDEMLIFIAVQRVLQTQQDPYILRLCVRLINNLIQENRIMALRSQQHLIIQTFLQYSKHKSFYEIRTQIYQTVAHFISTYLNQQLIMDQVYRMQLPQFLFQWLEQLIIQEHLPTIYILLDTLIVLAYNHWSFVSQTIIKHRQFINQLTQSSEKTISQNAQIILQQIQINNTSQNSQNTVQQRISNKQNGQKQYQAQQ